MNNTNFSYNYNNSVNNGINTPYQPAAATPSYQSQQFFTQPQGSTYFINSSYEIANIPTGSGVSAAICMAEGLLYLKTFQNGKPTLMSYRISPYIQEQNVPTSTENNNQDLITKLEERLGQLEKQVSVLRKNNTGGKVDEHLI